MPAFATRVALRDDLHRIGVEAGGTVMVHAAMSKVGPLLNGPDALIRALLDVLGPKGTMMAYTSWDSVHDDLLDDDGRVLAEWRDHVPGFDVAASRAVRMNGVIAEFVRTMPGARRAAKRKSRCIGCRPGKASRLDHGRSSAGLRIWARNATGETVGGEWQRAYGGSALGYHDARPSRRSSRQCPQQAPRPP